MIARLKTDSEDDVFPMLTSCHLYMFCARDTRLAMLIILVKKHGTQNCTTPGHGIDIPDILIGLSVVVETCDSKLTQFAETT